MCRLYDKKCNPPIPPILLSTVQRQSIRRSLIFSPIPYKSGPIYPHWLRRPVSGKGLNWKNLKIRLIPRKMFCEQIPLTLSPNPSNNRCMHDLLLRTTQTLEIVGENITCRDIHKKNHFYRSILNVTFVGKQLFFGGGGGTNAWC